MNDYAASCSRIETLSNAAQSMKECLVCSICLEFFKDPVTIKCGHRFCRKCILTVASNEHAACPFCNKKVQKRSIPKEGSEVVKLCVEKFKELIEAIQSDSGIEVLASCNKVKHTKESVCINEKPSTSRVEEGSIHSQGSSLGTHQRSIKSKVFSRGKKKLSLKKKEENTLDKYLHTEEKVKTWLETVTPENENKGATDSNLEEELLTAKKVGENTSPEKTSSLKENTEDHPSSSNHPNITEFSDTNTDVSPFTDNTGEKSKFKDIQMRLQKAEMIAKKQKSNTPLPTVRTPSSVPAASHSDVYDWRRVKTVGKEMQVNTFRTLNISIERVPQPIALNDTVPYDSTVNDSKNVSCESDTKNLSGNKNSSAQRIRLKSSINKENNLQEQNCSNVIQEYKSNNQSIESDNSQREDVIPVNHMNKKQLNDIIGIIPSSDSFSTPEEIRNLSNMSNKEYSSKPNDLSRFEKKSVVKDSSNKLIEKDSLNFNDEPSTSNIQNSPPKHKLSLKKKMMKPKSTQSQSYTDGTSHQEIIPSKSSPEKSKSRLSLRMLSSKAHEFSTTGVNKTKSNQTATSSSYRVIEFKKLGRICKKRKNVPFLHLGKLKSNEQLIICSLDHQQIQNIKVKSNLPANIDYRSILDNQSINQTSRTEMLMEVDETLPRVSDIFKRGSDDEMDDEVNGTVIEKNENKSKSIIVQTMSQANKSIDKRTDLTGPEKPKKSAINTTKPEVIAEALLNEIESSESNSEIPNSIDEHKKEIPMDVISLSSRDSEFDNNQKINDEKNVLNQKEKVSSDSDSESPVPCSITRKRKGSQRQKVLSTSSASSTPIKSPMKKKRTHSESSNDDDDDNDVSSIIGKWMGTTEGKVTKKPKISSSEKNLSHRTKKGKIRRSVCTSSEEEDHEMLDVAVEPLRKLQRDPPIDDIISKVKSYKQNEANTSRLTDIPSSLLSADIFAETNEHDVQPIVGKQPSEFASDKSSINAWNTEKKSEAGSHGSQNLEDVTVVDAIQFKKKNDASVSKKSFDGSDKENSVFNQSCKNAENIKNSEDQVDEITSSQHEKSKAAKIVHVNESYGVRDSLLEITQEQMGLKKLERDLLGVDLSAVIDDGKKGVQQFDKFSTPRRKIANVEVEKNEAEYDTDNIGATPVVKRRSRRFIRTSQSSSNSGESIMCSPEKDRRLIPAVTPVRNTRSYPLCHSTPMIDTPSPEKVPRRRKEKIVFVCSGLTVDGTKTVEEFAERFGATFQKDFSFDVTHVITQTDADTHVGKKTFKYIQGIAFRKFVVNFEWIVDCLERNRLLNEDDSKYEVLDADTLEPASIKARSETVNLFKDFAIYCQEPFQALSVEEFNAVLLYNGAEVVSSLKHLSAVKDKLKVIVCESETLNETELTKLRSSGNAIVFFEWVVDSISQYQIIPLAPYLYDMSVEEIRNLGFPPELLIEEETIEEEDESQ